MRTAAADVVYAGPPGVADLHCQRVRPGVIRTTWRLSKEERQYIAATGHIELEIFTEPIPPVALNCTDEVGVGEDAPEILDRLDELRR